MKKALLVVATALTLAGCATSTGKPVEVVNADRAVSYVNSENLPLMDDGSKARWGDAITIATNVCRKWG